MNHHPAFSSITKQIVWFCELARQDGSAKMNPKKNWRPHFLKQALCFIDDTSDAVQGGWYLWQPWSWELSLSLEFFLSGALLLMKLHSCGVRFRVSSFQPAEPVPEIFWDFSSSWKQWGLICSNRSALGRFCGRQGLVDTGSVLERGFSPTNPLWLWHPMVRSSLPVIFILIFILLIIHFSIRLALPSGFRSVNLGLKVARKLTPRSYHPFFKNCLSECQEA